jgi:hypothetical protein
MAEKRGDQPSGAGAAASTASRCGRVWKSSAARSRAGEMSRCKASSATMPSAWTPLSVRPAAVARGKAPPSSFAPAASITSWTEMPLDWRCQPTKSRPS